LKYSEPDGHSGGDPVRTDGSTWGSIAIAAAVLLAANLWCWQAGIGGGVPGRPPGTEVELYYGWPATYRAEWWRSEDPALGLNLLGRAPFFHPAGMMERRAGYTGVWAAVVDAAFGSAVLVVIWLGADVRARGWRRATAIGLGLAAAVLVGAWMVADRVSVHK
jgi:hypothetical protein